MPETVDTRLTNTDQGKLEMTDSRGLSELNKAFDQSFGPREGTGGTQIVQQPPDADALDYQPAAPPSRPEKAAAGHHAPVEVVPAKEPVKPETRLNILGEPEYVPKARTKKEEPAPTEPKKAAAGDKGKAKAESETGEAEGEEGAEGEEADPEVDAIRAKQNAHPNVKEGIKRLKAIAKARRAESRDLTKRLNAAEAALEEIKAKGIPPEVNEELTKLRQTSQRVDLLSDPDFKAKHEEPINQAATRLFDYVCQIMGNTEGVKYWREQTEKFDVRNLSSDYWDREIIPKVEGETTKARIAALAADLHAKVDERNKVVAEFVEKPDRMTEYKAQQSLAYFKKYADDAQDEANKIIASVGPWAQLRDVNAAKTDEERAEFEAHNTRCEGYKVLFEKLMGDLIRGDARRAVRIVTQAIYGMDRDREYKELEADYDAVEAENEQLKAQLNKISRARSIPARGGAGDAQVNAKYNGDGALSTKSAREAFKEYFGSQGT